jgi:hypothetical protein
VYLTQCLALDFSFYFISQYFITNKSYKNAITGFTLRPPARLPACPPARLPACPPARLPACPPARLPIYLSVGLFVFISIPPTGR